jgi:hypothetical protein
MRHEMISTTALSTNEVASGPFREIFVAIKYHYLPTLPSKHQRNRSADAAGAPGNNAFLPLIRFIDSLCPKFIPLGLTSYRTRVAVLVH